MCQWKEQGQGRGRRLIAARCEGAEGIPASAWLDGAGMRKGEEAPSFVGKALTLSWSDS